MQQNFPASRRLGRRVRAFWFRHVLDRLFAFREWIALTQSKRNDPQRPMLDLVRLETRMMPATVEYASIQLENNLADDFLHINKRAGYIRFDTGTANDYEVLINWDDGTESAGIVGTVAYYSSGLPYGAFVYGTHDYDDIGLYTVEVTVNGPGCSDTGTYVMEIHEGQVIYVETPVSVVESVGFATATIALALEHSAVPQTRDITVRVDTRDGFTDEDDTTYAEQAGGKDYVGFHGDVTIPVGATYTLLKIPITRDRRVDRSSQEYFRVVLSDPDQASFTTYPPWPEEISQWTRIDDEDITRIRFDRYLYSVIEPPNGENKNVKVTVQLSKPAEMDVTVRYSTNDEPYPPFDMKPPATEDDAGPPPVLHDYAPINALTLTFAPGEMRKTFNVVIHGDTEEEQTEYFGLILTDPTPAGRAVREDQPEARPRYKANVRIFDRTIIDWQLGTLLGGPFGPQNPLVYGINYVNGSFLPFTSPIDPIDGVVVVYVNAQECAVGPTCGRQAAFMYIVTALEEAGDDQADTEDLEDKISFADIDPIYNGATVDQQPTISLEFSNDEEDDAPTSIDVTLTFDGVEQDTVEFDSSNFVPGETHRLGVQVDPANPILETGIYDWSMELTFHYDGLDDVKTAIDGRKAVVRRNADNPFGSGWGIAGVDHIYTFGDEAIYVTGDGNAHVIVPDEEGGFTLAGGDFGTFTRNSDGTITYTTPDQTRRVFNSDGFLQRIVDRHDLTVTLVYDNNNNLLNILDPDGRVATFVYSEDQLLRIEQVGNRIMTFTFDDGNLVQIQNPDNGLRTFAYDEHDRLTVEKWGPATTTYSYHATFGYLTSIDQGLGTRTTLTVAALSWQNSPVLPATQEVAVIKDPLNLLTTYTFDSLNQFGVIQTPDGSIQHGQNDHNGLVSSYTDGAGATTFYLYLEDTPYVSRITYADGSYETFEYDETFHQLMLHVDTLGHRTTLTIDEENGDILAVRNARNQLTSFTWDAGRLINVTDPLNHVTTYHYDANRRPDYIIDAENGRTTITYDSAWNVFTITDALSRVTTTTYDSMRRMVKYEDPTFATTTYAYNAPGWLTSMTDALGHRTDYQYDQRGWLTRLTEAANTALLRMTTLAYDNVGRVTLVIDTIGRQTQLGYSDFARSAWVIDALSHSTTVFYDAVWRPLSSTDALNRVTSFAYDVRGRLSAQFDPLGRAVRTHFDSEGNLNRLRTPHELIGGESVVVNSSSTNGWQFNVSTAMNAEGDSIIVWTDIHYGGGADVYARLYDSIGNPRGAPFIVTESTTGDQGGTSCAMAPDGRFVVGWVCGTDAFARVFAADGTPLTGDIRVHVTTTGDQFGLQLAMDANASFIAVWNDTRSGNPTTYFRRFVYTGDSINATDQHVDSSAAGNPYSLYPVVAMNAAGSFVIGYSLYGSYTDSGWGSYVQRYTSAGAPDGDPFPISDSPSYDQTMTAIAMASSGAFLVVFDSSGQDGNGSGIFARLYDAAGDPVDDEFQVNTYSTGDQKYGRATVDGDGNFLVIWRSVSQFTSSKWDAIARQIGSDGAVIGSETRLTPASETEHSWITATIGADRDGDFMISWTNDGMDGEGYGVMARRFTSYVTTKLTYDSLNQLSTITEGYGTAEQRTTTLTYDDAGNLLTITDPRNTVTSFAYDNVGRAEQIIEAYGLALQRTTTVSYDAVGNVLSMIDPLGTTTSFAYDGVDRVIRTIEAYGTALARQTDAAYNALGQVISTINPRGVTMTYDYDALNRLTKIVEAPGLAESRTTTLVYDDLSDNVRTLIDPLQHRTTFSYDSVDRLIQVKDALNGLSTMVYDEVGQVLAMADPLNHRTTMSYDALGRVLTMTDPRGYTTTVAYDVAGNLAKVMDANSHITTMLYDHLDRLTEVINAKNERTSYSYDAGDNLIGIINGRGERGTLTYDALSRLTAQTDPLNHTVTYGYDLGDNLTRITDALGKFTTFAYDALHRQISALSATSGPWTTVYDANDNPIVSIDPLTHRTTTTFDKLDRPTQIEDPRNGLTTMAYDANDNLIRLIDPDTNTTTFVYDELDRQIRSIDPQSKTTTFEYDAASRLTSKIDRLGRKIEYAYDNANNLTGETWRNADTSVQNLLTFTYDTVGNQTSAANNAGSYSLQYDELNRVDSVTNPWSETLTFTYDAAGNRTLVQDSLGGVETSTYDAANRLTSRQFDDGSQHLRVDFAYTARDQLDTISRYSDLAGTTLVGLSSYAYDDAGRMTLAKHKNGAGSWFDTATYTYDVADRMTAEFHDGTPTSYAYDDSDQLTNDGVTSISYDAAGNRNSTGYTVDTGNRITTDGIWNYSYDDEGNLIEKENIEDESVWTFQYSVANELILAEHVNKGEELLASIEYAYDAWGNLVERDDGESVTRYALDGWKVSQDFWGNTPQQVGLENFDVWADLDGSNALVARRVYGDQVDQPIARVDSNGTAWYHQDVRGSVVALTNTSGTVQTQYAYDGFGNSTVTGSTSFADAYRYTARFFDNSTGLQYNRARWYDPTTGRWITQDPMGFGAGDANLYRYAGNGQTNRMDPSGLEAPSGVLTPEERNYYIQQALEAFRRLTNGTGTRPAAHGRVDRNGDDYITIIVVDDVAGRPGMSVAVVINSKEIVNREWVLSGLSFDPRRRSKRFDLPVNVLDPRRALVLLVGQPGSVNETPASALAFQRCLVQGENEAATDASVQLLLANIPLTGTANRLWDIDDKVRGNHAIVPLDILKVGGSFAGDVALLGGTVIRGADGISRTYRAIRIPASALRALTPTARAALARLGLTNAQIDTLATGRPVAFLVSGAAEGTTGIAQLMANGTLRAGILTIKNKGRGLLDMLQFHSQLESAARSLGGREFELVAFEVTNPEFLQVLLRGGFLPTAMECPAELGGGIANGISRVFPVK